MSLAEWKRQFLEETLRAPPACTRVYVCLACQQVFTSMAEYDFDLCANQQEIMLHWHAEEQGKALDAA
ncbi:MAG: hypothetical protein DMG57_31930 [Acidobacteria bacterium]|nr:MAG: hypothetical protein DMG57_31930 [Acidobacteriota bacterium]